MNIILCGYHCSGKTTIAKAFAKKYHYQFIDTDHLISEEMSVNGSREAYTLLGEQDFRALEKNIVHSIKGIKNSIIATGGGVLVNCDNANHLRTLGKIMYLYLDPEIILKRILEKKSLPHFIRESAIDEDFKSYINSRKTSYDSQSDITLNTTGKTVDEIVSLINQYRTDHGI
jgi:shikimate kinase